MSKHGPKSVKNVKPPKQVEPKPPAPDALQAAGPDLADAQALTQTMARPEAVKPRSLPAVQRAAGNKVARHLVHNHAARNVAARKHHGPAGGAPSLQAAGPDVSGMEVEPEIEESVQAASGSGLALPDYVRKPMEDSFDQDFTGVRIHADNQADQLNRSLNARAFTTGQDIFFREDEYQPGTSDGQQLLAHELTHVVQQSGGGGGVQPKLVVGQPDDIYEQEAEAISHDVVGGQGQNGPAQHTIARKPAGAVQRAEDEPSDEEIAKQKKAAAEKEKEGKEKSKDEGDKEKKDKEEEKKEKEEAVKDAGDKAAGAAGEAAEKAAGAEAMEVATPEVNTSGMSELSWPPSKTSSVPNWDAEVAAYDSFVGGDFAALGVDLSGLAGDTTGVAVDKDTREQMLADAFAEGAMEGAIGGGISVAMMVGLKAFSKKFPKAGAHAGALVGLAQIAMDPKGWYEETLVKGIAGKAEEIGSSFAGMGEGSGWNRAASFFEGLIAIMELVNNVLNLVSLILQIFVLLCAILGALAPVFPPVTMPAFSWAIPIPGILQPYINIIGTITSILELIILVLRPLVIIFRTIDILYFESDPEKLREKQAKLKGQVSAFVTGAMEAGADKAADKLEGGGDTKVKTKVDDPDVNVRDKSLTSDVEDDMLSIGGRNIFDEEPPKVVDPFEGDDDMLSIGGKNIFDEGPVEPWKSETKKTAFGQEREYITRGDDTYIKYGDKEYKIPRIDESSRAAKWSKKVEDWDTKIKKVAAKYTFGIAGEEDANKNLVNDDVEEQDAKDFADLVESGYEKIFGEAPAEHASGAAAEALSGHKAITDEFKDDEEKKAYTADWNARYGIQDTQAYAKQKLESRAAELPPPPLEVPDRVDADALAIARVQSERAALEGQLQQTDAIAKEGQGDLKEFQTTRKMVAMNQGLIKAHQQEIGQKMEAQGALSKQAQAGQKQADEGGAKSESGGGLMAIVLPIITTFMGQASAKNEEGSGGNASQKDSDPNQGTEGFSKATRGTATGSEASKKAAGQADEWKAQSAQTLAESKQSQQELEGADQHLAGKQAELEQGISEYPEMRGSIEEKLAMLDAEEQRLYADRSDALARAAAWTAEYKIKREQIFTELEQELMGKLGGGGEKEGEAKAWDVYAGNNAK